MEKLLSVKETAELLSIDVGTLYNWVSQGRIPYKKLSNKCIRFDTSKLQRWLNTKEVEPCQS